MAWGCRRLPIRWIVATLLVGLYAIPLFIPPAATPLRPSPADATLLTYLFPDVPSAWIVVRLTALVGGALLIASATGSYDPPTWSRGDETTGVPRLVFWSAVALLFASFHVEVLGRGGQILYLIALYLPAIGCLAARKTRSRAPAAERADDRTWQLATVALIAIWVVATMSSAVASPLATMPVDTWQNVRAAAVATTDGRNLLLSADQPTMNDLHMLLAGVGMVPVGFVPILIQLQVAGIAWCALGGWCAAHTTARLHTWRFAPLAAAVVLFAPQTLGLCHFPYPFVMGIAGPAAMLLLLSAFLQRRTPEVLLALFATAGLTATQGYVATWSGPIVLAALVAGVIPCTVSLRTWIAAAAILLAAIIPSLRSIDAAAFSAEVMGSHWPWWAAEAYLFDQAQPLSPKEFAVLGQSARDVPLEIALSAILSPFVHPRTALRIWGDTLLEPWSSFAMLVGVFAAIRRLRTPAFNAFAVAALLFVELPVALTTSYDRISALRNLALPVAAAIFAAHGVALIGQRFTARQRTICAAVAPILVAVSGATLFYRIQPGILAEPSVGLYLRETTDLARGPAYFLYPPAVVHSRIDEIDRYFPRNDNIRFQAYLTNSDLPKLDTNDGSRSLWWSPGTEAECGIADAVCERWPDARIYHVRGTSGLTSVFAATRTPLGALADERSVDIRAEAFDCGNFPPRWIGPRRFRWCTPRDQLPARGDESLGDGGS